MLQQTFILYYFTAALPQKLRKKGAGHMLISFCFQMHNVMHDVTDHTIRQHDVTGCETIFLMNILLMTLQDAATNI